MGSFRVELLEDINYTRWSMHMQTLFISRGLWKYVNGSFPCPEAETSEDGGLTEDEAVTNWMNSDEKAKAYILLTLSVSDWKLVQNCKTSNEMWLKLKEMYEPKDLNSKAKLMRELISIRMNNVHDVHDIRFYVQYFFNTVNKLNRMGVEIDEDLLCIMLLNALPDCYENFRRIIESREELPALYDLGTKITDEGMIMDFSKTPEKPKGNERSSDLNNSATLEVLNEKQSKQDSDSALSNFIGGTRNPCWFLDSKLPYHFCSSSQIDRIQAPSSLKPDDIKIDPLWAKFLVPGTLTIGSPYCERTLTIQDILHIPSFDMNVLSVSKLTDMGYTVIFYSTHARIVDNNGCNAMIANRTHEFYYVYEGTYEKGAFTSDDKEPEEKCSGIGHRLKNWFRKLLWR